MTDPRDKCPLCYGETIGSANTRYCRNPDCELCDIPVPGVLLDKMAETQALLDKEAKDHWHKHRIALKLQRQLSIAVDSLVTMRNNCWEYAAEYMDFADNALEKIKGAEKDV